MSEPLPSLPAQPADVAWPTEAWPTGEPPTGARSTCASVAEQLFDGPSERVGETRALVVVHGGRVVLERYGEGTTAETPLLSWSIAKSVLHAVVGILVDRGQLVLDEPAPVAAWGPSDPRRAITLRHLLTFTDGLAWSEDYVDGEVSDVIEMLFGSGADDVAAFAASRPLAHEPGTAFRYSSGTSNIVSSVVADLLGSEECLAFVREELLEPIGVHDARLDVDPAGTWIASSALWCTARDYARFGLLYLRGGRWDDRRILSSEWVDTARTPTGADADGTEHAAHWWIWPGDRHGAFYASGYENQRIVVVPGLDLVVVKLGRTDASIAAGVDAELDRLIRSFGPGAG